MPEIMSPIRAFWAITPPERIIAALAANLLPMFQKTLGKALRLTPLANLHLTVKFLGDVEEAALKAIRDEMPKALFAIVPFTLRLQHIDAFPAWQNARIIWLGVDVVPEGFLSLHQQCDIIATAYGVARETRRFCPHLTLGRVRGDLPRQAEQLVKTVNFTSETFLVDSLELFASKLTPAGAQYSLIECFKLQGAER